MRVGGGPTVSLHNLYSWLRQAQQNGYAIGAFNANTMEQMQAIALAAQAEQTCAIIQISHRALLYAGSGNTTRGLQYMAAVGKIAAQSVEVPIALHLDHADKTEVLQAIALGFTSVMFDGGDMPFEENVAITKELCQAAHTVGVCVEAEIGDIPKGSGAAHGSLAVNLTSPEQAREFVANTGVDTLAVALGSVHGLTEKRISLDLRRLKAIRSHVDVPLVLHGSSGVNDDDIAAGIKLGLCKVNVATQLNKAFTDTVRSILSHDRALVDPRDYLGPGRDIQMEAVRERIRFYSSSGKGHDDLMHESERCR